MSACRFEWEQIKSRRFVWVFLVGDVLSKPNICSACCLKAIAIFAKARVSGKASMIITALHTSQFSEFLDCISRKY